MREITKEKKREYQRRYREKHPGQWKIYQKRCIEKNPNFYVDRYSKAKNKNPDVFLKKHREEQRIYRKEHLEKLQQKDRNYYENKHEMINQKIKLRRIKEPYKDIAQKKARYLKNLSKECAQCGATEHLEKHHPDYSKPLEVIVLCASCHRRLHSPYPS
jgi:lipopolysaccharide export LptBFGC system permease protein LptF